MRLLNGCTTYTVVDCDCAEPEFVDRLREGVNRVSPSSVLMGDRLVMVLLGCPPSTLDTLSFIMQRESYLPEEAMTSNATMVSNLLLSTFVIG